MRYSMFAVNVIAASMFFLFTCLVTLASSPYKPICNSYSSGRYFMLDQYWTTQIPCRHLGNAALRT